VKAYEVLDQPDRAALTDDLVDALEQYATLADGTLVVPAEYLEVVATRA